MTGRDITSIIFTFIVGFFFGVFLYFTGGLQTYEKSDVQSRAEADSFTIVSEVYGGCMTSCPSFKIESDGSYRYLFTPGPGEDPVIRDGGLPRGLKREISGAVTVAGLNAQSQRIQPSYCNSYTDGIDVKYRITVGGELYILDTCGTNIDTTSTLWNTLVKTWTYFETEQI